MISKQDRVRPRTVEDLERKYQDVFNRKTQQQQQQSKGEDGLTPYIGENGNWWIGNADTGVSASGTKVTFTPAVTEGSYKGYYIGTLTIGDIVTEMYAPGDVVYSEREKEYYLQVGGTFISETQLQQLLALLQ